jgi:Mg2+ and Co2+ transporter CorA
MTQLENELHGLLADDYLDGLTDRSLEEIRSMRAACQQAEAKVSFLRRLAQGRLDIIHAFLDRREDEGDEVDLSDLVDDLPAIIAAGPPRPSGPGRLPSPLDPDMEGGALTGELDQVIDAEQVGKLGTMTADQLRQVAEQVAAFEARVSHQRRALHERIDRLQREIVERYKTGGASADELLR